MNFTASVSAIALAALVAAVAGSVACSADNPPATSTATGGADTATGGASADATGGAATAAATGGAPAATSGTGGADTATGGADTATGGATAASGTYTPVPPEECIYPEAADAAPPPDDADGPCMLGEKKNATCAADREGITCYKNCGPRNSSGWKPLTCTAGVITEDSTCRWTGTDYSIWRVPPTLEEMDPACPAEGTPRATEPCDVPSCISCANRTTAGYEDSGGAAKGGWCTCVGDEGDRTWTCGTAGKAWPCPGNPGC